jgi:hypothetical protein
MKRYIFGSIFSSFFSNTIFMNRILNTFSIILLQISLQLDLNSIQLNISPIVKLEFNLFECNSVQFKVHVMSFNIFIQ